MAGAVRPEHMRLKRGNWEKAILAFIAAIAITSRTPDVYVGCGGAYIDAGETGKNLADGMQVNTITGE